MLSKTERSYISGIFSPSYAYKRVLNYRINKKLNDFFRSELPLIQKSTVTTFSNIVTEFGNNHCTEAHTSREATTENGLGGLRSLDL